MTRKLITWPFVALFIAASQLWYIFTSGGSVFYNAVTALNDIINGMSELFNPSTTATGVIISATTSPLHQVAKDLYIIIELLIVVGIIAFLVKKTRMRFDKEYAALAVGSFLMLLAAIAVPGVAPQLNTSRFFQISLIFLAPFAVLGGLAIVYAVRSVMRVPGKLNCEYNFFKAFSIFLAVFLLFSTGFVYAIAEPHNSTAIPLNAAFDAPRFNNKEVAGAVWLGNEKSNSTPVYGDEYRVPLLKDFFFASVDKLMVDANNVPSTPTDAYVYLGGLNVQQGKLVVTAQLSNEVGTRSYIGASVFTSGRSRLYDDGGAHVYY